MLFMYIHTHTPENCWAVKPQEALQLFSSLREGCQKEGVKIVSACSAAHEHTFYWLLESDDISALENALKPLTKMGTARLIPVIEQEYMKQ